MRASLSLWSEIGGTPEGQKIKKNVSWKKNGTRDTGNKPRSQKKCGREELKKEGHNKKRERGRN